MRQIHNQKKGQMQVLNSIPSYVGLLIMIGIILFVGVFLMDEMVETSGTSLNASIENETLTTVTEAGESTSVHSSAIYADCDIINSTLIVTNSSDVGGGIITAANYTHSACIIYYAGGSAADYNNTDWNVSFGFTYTDQDTFYNVTAGGSEGLQSTGDFQSLFGLIIAAAAILGLIVMFKGT